MAEQVNGSLLFRCIDCGGSYGPAMMWLDSGRCVVCAVCDAVSVTRASASGATTSTADAIKAATLEANAKGEGFKADQEKTDFTLLPWEPLEDVARVMMLGAEKYARDNWQRVPNGRWRYLAAALRHIVARIRGEVFDPETGKPHLSHAVCCCLFAAWFDRQESKP